MNDLPRQALSEIVARHGRSVAGEARRVEGLLRDYCGAYRREIAVLVNAVEERVTADLLAIGAGLPRQALLARLTHRLHDNLAMDTTAAKWAVNSWALALGVMTSAELEAIEHEQPESATASPPAAASQAAPGAALRQMRQNPSTEIVVSASGDGDFTSLGQALRAAASGARILVRPGLYREGIVLDKPVEIIGESELQEVIIASAKASCILMRTDEATVRGLTLRQEQGAGGEDEAFFAVDIPQGCLTLEDSDISSRSLSCIGIHNDSADPVIRRCRIHTGADSGIYVFNAAQGLVEDCDIHDNANVGVAITERANPTIRRCAIRAGKDAGVVSWNGGLGLIEECEISGNARAGVGVSEQANLSILRCRIYDGANSGVFVHNNGQATLEDCDIYGHAEPEMAVRLGGKIIARGCSIHEGNSSGVLIDSGGIAVLEQCNVQSNASAGISVNADGVAALNQCCINRNGGAAVRVQSGGKAAVENCDLTKNRSGAWETQRGAVIKELGNQS
ncbi:MAG: right-handed parallel beta-helix repeat-containing protein [Blastocatellia bacterium]